jgi:hypothetical protein
MKKEIRTRIVEPDEAVDAAFALLSSILENPEMFPDEYNGATFRVMESVESDSPNHKEYSFEVRLRESRGTLSPLPEMSRLLVDA